MTDPKPIDAPDAPDDSLPEPKNDVVDEPGTETDAEQETAGGIEP